jgi:hypothetical protein
VRGEERRMGYYTRYEAEAMNDSMELDMAMMAKDMDLGQLIGTYTNGYENPFDDRCKWYDHMTDMARFSKDFPNVTFKLSGEGEEMPDLWVAYFRNGKGYKEKATITYAPFDEGKMK